MLDRPLHVRYKTNAFESVFPSASSNLLNYCSGSVLIEESALQMHVGPIEQIELAVLLRGGDIDSCCAQVVNVFVTAHGINDVNGLLAPFEAIFYEWQQDTILVFVAFEEGTDVTLGAKHRSPDSNRSIGFRQIVSLYRPMLQIPTPDGDFRNLDSNPESIGRL